MSMFQGKTGSLSGWFFIAVLVSGLLLSSCIPAQPVQTTQPALNSTPGVPKAIGNDPTNTAQPILNNPSDDAPGGAIDGPLSVVIESPADNTIVNHSPLEITGQADPETVITINDTIILVEEDRRFSVEIALVDGINLIEIIASDQDENQEFFYLTVDYEVQP